MRYKMEELVGIVGKLAEKYTAHESTSIAYEKAEQLMGAVLYCIHEAEQSKANAVIPAEGISAQRMYELGVKYVREKTKKALDLYNALLPEFSSYENRCLYDTFVNGLPEFFQWYDIQFEPQNTILTLDYPVLKDISGYSGIDRVYEFIVCIHLEQKFLHAFPKDYVIRRLSAYHTHYGDLADNICEIMFLSVIEHILAGKPLSKEELEETDYVQIQKIFTQKHLSEIEEELGQAIKKFVQEYYSNCSDLLEYLTGSIDDVLIRLKNDPRVSYNEK